MTMKKDCETCRHGDVGANAFPCSSCKFVTQLGYTHWEAPIRDAVKRTLSRFAAGPINIPAKLVDDPQMPLFPELVEQKEPEATGVDAILAERGSRYGKFIDHAAITQKIKRAIFDFNPDLKLDDDQKEALEMIAHKIGRIVNGDPNYADSWVDIAGYAKLVADRLEGNIK